MEKLDLAYFDFYQVLLTFMIIIVSIVLSTIFLAKKLRDIYIIALLIVWHSLFAAYYWFYSLTNVADATLYYSKTFKISLDLTPGTRFTESVAYTIVKVFDSNYLNTTLISGLIGGIGLGYFYLAIKQYIFAMNRLWLLILFIPSMSFWSSGLGKDSISFFATCLFVYAVTHRNKKLLAIIFSMIAMFMVRPHITLMMLGSFIIYFIIKSKTHIVMKILLLPLIFGIVAITLQYTQDYVGLTDGVSLENLDNYVNTRQGYNQGGSFVDISSMSYPMQMFTYIFRPLPFEAHSIVALITSLENTILLLLFCFIIIKSKSKFNFKAFTYNENSWLLIYAFLTCTILAITTANLGIATRQKWMFMPALLYLLVFSYHDYKIKSNSN